jgi:hypothetical protein
MKRTNDQKISEVIREFKEKNQIGHKLYQKKLESLWIELFGSITEGYLEKFKLQQKMLTVYLKSPVLRKELNMNKTVILDTLNKRLAEDQLEDINFR